MSFSVIVMHDDCAFAWYVYQPQLMLTLSRKLFCNEQPMSVEALYATPGCSFQCSGGQWVDEQSIWKLQLELSQNESIAIESDTRCFRRPILGCRLR
jgi:hypothetical protein